MPSLQDTIDSHLHTLTARLDRAAGRLPGLRRPGDRRASTDDFLVPAAQHVTAVIQVVLPAAQQHLPHSRGTIREYIVAAKRLERALVVAKAKQYGQAQNIGRGWSEVWRSVRDDLAAVTAAESTLVVQLSEVLSTAEAQLLGDRLAAAARRSPTRPHPHLPHSGFAGWVVRGVWGRADRVWDELEGRVTRPLPAP